MSPVSPPLSVKTPSSSIQPSTTNESIILIFTQLQGVQDTLEDVKDSVTDLKTEMKSITEKISDLEKRLSIEERDKKIIIGFIAIGLPIILTAIQLIIT